MRQVLLNSVYYKLAAGTDIIKRALNPFRAKLGTAGSLEFSDFSQASMEEYHDFRNGIGKNRGVGSDARTQWTQGIDFSTEGQAVLSPLVSTAGTFGKAPIKIIDFQSATYAIGDDLIAEWTSGTTWTSRETNLSDPIDVLVVTDGTDEYIVASSASTAYYSTDGTTWGELSSYKTPDSTNDPDTAWTDDGNAIDGDDSTFAFPAGAANYLEVVVTNSIYTDSCRIRASNVGDTNPNVTIDFYYDGAWFNVFGGTITKDTWVTKTNSSGYKVVEKARVKSSDGANFEFRLFQFAYKMRGHIASYDNRLFFITTDGRFVGYSAVDNIDEHGGAFGLIGKFGTVHDLFEGKLLADGSPTLYFTGTEGLHSIDVANEKSYQQEVSYPPLTNAGRRGIYWNANVYVAAGYGVLKVAPTTATFVGPDQDDGLPATYQGKIYDFATANNWLIYCVNGGTTDKSSILKRNSSLGGNLQVYTTASTNNPIACMWHSPSSLYTNGRLWFGEGTSVKYMMFPDTTSNVKQISTYEYVDDSGFGDLPIFRKLAAISKTALGVAAITKSCDADETIQVFYGLNGADATTSLGSFITSPRPTILTFNSGLGTEFYTIQLAIKLFRGTTNTNSPELESLLFYYFATPATISAWTFRIEATDDNSEALITAFEALRDTNTLVTFFPSGDTAKTSYNVKLTTMPMRYWVENQTTRQGYIEISLEEVFNG